MPQEAHRLWSVKLSGYVSELNISEDGGALLAATIPNNDRPGGAKDARIHYFQVNGSKRQIWDRVMKTQVKAQAISSDGAFVTVVTHDDKMMALNSRGKELWAVDASCAPTILKTRQEIICYHDDDPEAEVAFDVYDWKGAKKASFPIKDDILTMKVSSDERWVVLALTHGNVLVLDSSYKQVWSRNFDSEVVDVDVSSGANPRVAVLRLGVPQKVDILSLMAPQSEKLEISPELQIDQLGFLDDSLFGYGNGERGQILSRLTGWKKTYAKNAHYTPSLIFSPGQIMISFEEVQAGVRRSRVLAFAPGSDLLWRIEVGQELKASEDSYLYLKSWTSKAHRLAVAMDDGSLGVFEIKR